MKNSGRALAPHGGNDRIMTPPETARLILAHFRPHGRILEPCCGSGSFSNLMPGCDWCELDEGRDFLALDGHWGWIVTNPPWSKFRDFLRHGMEVADNIVFLCLINAWFMRARQRDMAQAGFGLVEILHVPVPPPPWPQAGFCLGAGWLRRGWTGGVHFSHPTESERKEVAAQQDGSLKQACTRTTDELEVGNHGSTLWQPTQSSAVIKNNMAR